MTTKHWLQLGGSILITAAVFYWLWDKLDISRLLQIVTGMHLGWFVFAAGALVLLQWVRAVRLEFLLRTRDHTANCAAANEPPRLDKLFPLTCVQAVLNKFLPAWASEAALVYFLKKYLDLHLSKAAASVVLVRLFDIFIIALAAIIGLSVAPDDFSAQTRWIVFIAGSGMMIAMLSGVVVCRRFAARIPVATSSNATAHWQARLSALGGRLIQETDQLLSNGYGLVILVLSMLIWCIIILRLTAILWCLDADISLLTVIWVNLLIAPIRLLPIKGVANLGTHEAAWIFALTMTGSNLDSAALYAAGTHAVMFLTVGVLLVFTLFWIGLNRRVFSGERE